MEQETKIPNPALCAEMEEENIPVGVISILLVPRVLVLALLIPKLVSRVLENLAIIVEQVLEELAPIVMVLVPLTLKLVLLVLTVAQNMLVLLVPTWMA